MLITNGNTNHYCYIKNLSRLLSKQITNRNNAIFICDGCLLFFNKKDTLMNHQKSDCVHIRTEIPLSNVLRKDWFGTLTNSNKVKFESYHKKLKIPFVIYADFESFLRPIYSCSNNPSTSHTENVQKHDVYSFGYYIKCSYDDSISKYVSYTGNDCEDVFIQSLIKDLENIIERNTFRKPPISLSERDANLTTQERKCYVCDLDLNCEDFIVYDSCTGEFKGVAHKICGKKYIAPDFVPVILHNMSHYDAHFIVRALHVVDGNIQVIPQNKERYISFSKILKISNRNISLRFIDSLKFMSSSLEKLSQNLNDEQFIELRKIFPINEDFTRVKRKGIYPYEQMQSFHSLTLTTLPPKEGFYNSISDSYVSDEDYKHAKDVWQHFKCKNMGDYSNLYLKTDVLLLTDVFENFRNVCINTYYLDPCHYYTAPGLSWDAMMKLTKVELELLSDFEIISFLKSGIRGGISQCSNRYAKANNQFMEDYNKEQPDSYLIYLDANNLYGWAMSQYLPINSFEWVDVNTKFDVPDDSDYGYILEVDLEYPEVLHDTHSDLPLCPERICTGQSIQPKLVTNLNDKTKYVIHYRNLKQCLSLGLILKKVHRILKFRQSPWLKQYIDLNTSLRTLSKNDFEKDFYKLMNNSIFGKTMENIEKRVDVRLLTHWENIGKIQGAQSLIARPEFHSLSIFSENLVAVQLKKVKVVYNKPIYLGFCILDISKTLMFDFHYNYMKNKFVNLKLLYTDTDSLVYQIYTKNFYRDIKPDLEKYFDTSDYTENNIYNYDRINKKKIGVFKDENNGKIFREFVGLRSKMYSMIVDNKLITKAKGVNKSVTKKLTFKNFESCLLNNTVKLAEMYRFKSIKHIVFTQKINKICLSSNDSKRYLIPNSTDTLAWGHYSLR